MTSILDVYNQALGISGARANLVTTASNTRERELCDLYYPAARNASFVMAFWPDLNAVKSLALISERDFSVDWADGDPHPPWRFAYALPSDYVRARYLDSMGTFAIGRRAAERVLLTDQVSPVLVYTGLVDTPGSWETDLFETVVATLALKLAPSMSLSSSAMQNVMTNYQLKVSDALVHQANLAHTHMPEAEPLSRTGSFYLPPEIPDSIRGYMGTV